MDLEPADPAAGTLWNTQVPMDEVWRPHSVGFTFTTAGAVANRIPRVTGTAPSARVRWTTTASIPQANGLGWRYSFHAGGVWLPAAVPTGSIVTVGLGEVYLFPQDFLTISVENMQAADQLSLIMVCVEKSGTGGVGHPDWASWWEGGMP